jgi:hypothetical protein
MITFITPSGQIMHSRSIGASVFRVATKGINAWGLSLVLGDLDCPCGFVDSEADAVMWVARGEQ